MTRRIILTSFGLVGIAWLTAGATWFHISEERPRVIIQIDQMPADAKVELWYNGSAVELSKTNLELLVLERAEK